MNSVNSVNTNREALVKYMGKRVTQLAKEIYGSRDRAFCHFALQLLYGLDDEDAEAACSFGAANDGGIDALWQDEDGGRVVIALAKYHAKGTLRVDRRPVTELSSAWSWLSEPSKASSARLRSQLAQPAAALAQAGKENPKLRTELLAVVAGALTPAAIKQVDAFNAQHSAQEVELRLVGIPELIDADLTRRSLDAGPIVGPITLELRQYFEEPAQRDGVPTLVASINGQQLATIEQEYRFQIFQRNVRYQLPGKINENIDRTLQQPDGRRNFWYYNNGISIVCDRFKLNAKKKTVQVYNLQIVNGCQTTTTLSANAANLSDPASAAVVLVRIIASESDELQRDITIYNNRQNAVKDRDLLSNDPCQERLQGEFEALHPPWFYERKRGGWKAEVASNAKRREVFGTRIINNEKAAQAAYAFHYDPGEARARKRLLFVTRKDDPAGFYDHLFGEFTTPEWLLVPFLVDKFVVARKNEYMRQSRQLEERPADKRSVAEKLVVQRSWIKFADQAFVGTIAFYWRHRIELSQDNLEALADPGLLEEKLLPRSYALALRDLTLFFANRTQEYANREETFVAANFLKGNWSEIRAHLVGEEDYRTSIQEDPFAGLPVVGSP
jgi:hypothetical protein